MEMEILPMAMMSAVTRLTHSMLSTGGAVTCPAAP
jgi:hypothetical protein